MDQNIIKSKIDIKKNIYRYKFSEEFIKHLYQFSKIHQYDDRKTFKESWVSWKEENDELVFGEVRRLRELEYDGDILDKMFKSARYYFRKKSTEKKAPQERRIYVGCQKETLIAIDNHIYGNVNNKDYKPSSGFADFCKTNETIFEKEVIFLFKSGIKDEKDIQDKLKKTYKNRYFNIINK